MGRSKVLSNLNFLSQYLSKKGYKIFILSKNVKKKKDIIKNVYFGKNIKFIQSPNIISGYSNLIDYFFFNFFLVFKYFSIRPKNIIFFNKKALFCSFLLSILKTNKIKFIYHNFDFELVENTKNFVEIFLINLEFKLSKLCDYLIFPSPERSNYFKKIQKIKLVKYFLL